jgi:hypothetical protein
MSALNPESSFLVSLSAEGILCRSPDGESRSVRWEDLEVVEILTTDDGPFAPDVFWMLHGSNGGVSVPQGASGESELVEKLQSLEGFNNEAFIEAMASTTNQSFVCWKKPV